MEGGKALDVLKNVKAVWIFSKSRSHDFIFLNISDYDFNLKKFLKS